MTAQTAQASPVSTRQKRYKEYLVRLDIADAIRFDAEAATEKLKGATYMRCLVLKNMQNQPVS